MNKKIVFCLIFPFLVSCNQGSSNIHFSVVNGQKIEAIQETARANACFKAKEYSKEDFLNMTHMSYEKTYSLEVENKIQDKITATIHLLDNGYEPIFKVEYNGGWYQDPLGETFSCNYSDGVLTMPDLEYDFDYLFLRYGYTENDNEVLYSKRVYWEVIICKNQLEN